MIDVRYVEVLVWTRSLMFLYPFYRGTHEKYLYGFPLTTPPFLRVPIVGTASNPHNDKQDSCLLCYNVLSIFPFEADDLSWAS